MAAALLLPAQMVLADLPGDLLNGLTLLDYRPSGKYGSYFTKNYLGKGWDFDTTAVYTGQTYHFGLADLTLGGTSASPVQVSAGYTLRGLPSARFSMKTSNPEGLSYTLKANYGAQDLTATGSVLINVDTTINALGFYDTTFQISNRGTYQTDGLAGKDQGTLAFDAGPIVVSGNAYADLLAAITQPFFTASATENPFAKFSQKSARLAGEPIDLTASSLDVANLNSNQVGQLVNNSIISALLGNESTTNLFGNVLMPAGLLTDGSQAQSLGLFEQVPEPAMLGLMTLGLAFCRPRRKAS
jgi:hypothetical protein